MDEIRLNIGSGKTDFGKSWIHIDSGKYDHTVNFDVKHLPHQDNTVSEIYSSHLLAYFDREEGLEVLKEWNRVLKPGGKLLIAVPDFEAMAKLYVGGKWPIEDFLGPLYGKIDRLISSDTKCGVITSIPQHGYLYHKTTYDERSLSKALHKAGFGLILKDDYTNSRFNNDDQSHAFLPDRNPQGTLISLNLIAYK